MKKYSLILALFLCCQVVVNAQEYKYYKDRFRTKEVSESKSRFYERTTTDGDVVTIEFLQTKGDLLLDFKAYKNEQPYLVWKSFDKKGNLLSALNYEFEIDYIEDKPEDVIYFDLGKNDFVSETQGKLEKPTLIGNLNYRQLLIKTLRYPRYAKRRGIQGQVVLLYKISKEGKGFPIAILSGTEKHLDKEAARFLREIPEWEPAKLNNELIDVYAVVGVNFVLYDN